MQELSLSESSSNLYAARFYPDEQRLEIDFKDLSQQGSQQAVNSTYEYRDFQASDWEAFSKAESKGRWFSFHIRQRKKVDGTPYFPFRRIA